MNIFLVFLTGLTTGGISCLAMQGGLLAGMIANQKGTELDGPETKKSKVMLDNMDWMPVGLFLVVKLISHTALGFLLGLMGSFFTLSLGARLAFQLGAAIFMFASAMNLLEVHPIFRLVVLQPPKFIQRWVRGSTKVSAFFGPALLGFMTIFIPCGVTQAMEVVAISSGSPVIGAVTMFAFVLGTSPIFATIGVVTAKLSEVWQQRFLRFAAATLVFMSLYSINGILTVVDSPLSLQRLATAVSSIGSPPEWYGGGTSSTVKEEDGVQKATITIKSGGYTPNYFVVRSGVPVELTLESSGVYSCASSFTFKKFKIFEQLKPTDKKTLTFTPTEKGEFTFACSMGMYQGVMKVI